MRDEKVIGIRPKLQLELSDSDDMERFQNSTLRPVLKFQSPLSHSLLYGSNHFQQMLEKINQEDKRAFEEAVQKYVNFNVVFKNRLVGLVIGLFTQDELAIYVENPKEINKRIVAMQVQRFVDIKFPIS